MKPPFLFLMSLGIATYSQTTLQLDLNLRQQKFEGWGTSLCWWANGVGRWSDANLNPLLARIVDKDSGLGYSIFRYNIGGGDQPGHDHFREFGDIPGYKPKETGPYDWNADPYQRLVAQKINALSPNAIWEAFSNSPPWWMTKSGCTAGHTDGSDNLKLEYYEDFADYQTEVVKQFRDQWKITFRTVTPFNEPSPRWWIAQKNQEGCGFKENQSRMITILGRALLAKKLISTTVSASDENSITDAIARAKEYTDTSLGFITQMNTHSYFGKNDRKEYATLAAKYGKRIWQSESGPLSWPGGNQLDVSLWMADVIIKDIREMRVNAWMDWQSLGSGVWSSFTTDYGKQKAIPNKRFYMHAQFSRFIRPGSEILVSTDSNSLAAFDPATSKLVVVILNPLLISKDYLVDFSGFKPESNSATLYRTSETENCERLSQLPFLNQRVVLELTKQSITSMIVKITGTNALSQKGIPIKKKHSVLRYGKGGNQSLSILVPTHKEIESHDLKGQRNTHFQVQRLKKQPDF